MPDYDLVALRVVLGTATLQAPVSDLRKKTALEKLKRQVTEHAAKCFDEAVAKAKEEWRKIQ